MLYKILNVYVSIINFNTFHFIITIVNVQIGKHWYMYMHTSCQTACGSAEDIIYTTYSVRPYSRMWPELYSDPRWCSPV